jgi:hypothetical protein
VVLVSRMTLHLRSEGAKQSRTPNTSSVGVIKPMPVCVNPTLGQLHTISHHEGGFVVGGESEVESTSEMEMGRVRFTRAGRVSDVECQRCDLAVD